MPVIYDQLRALAARYMRSELPGHTLQATALVHEAYMRLANGKADSWDSDAHFFAAAATSVRRILVEHARSRRGARRIAARADIELFELENVAFDAPGHQVLAVDEALVRLADVNAQQARMVEMRFFGGMNTDDIAEALSISPRTIARDWVLAKAWLARELRDLGLDH